MADTSLQVNEGSGVHVDTRTESTNGNHRQVVVIGDPATNAGVAPVDPTNGLAVDVKQSALPTGASTSAKQETGNISLNSIDTTLTNVTETNAYTSDKEMRFFSQSHICTENTTTTPLTGNATFAGGFQECIDYSEIAVTVLADQNSATDGLVISWSQDGSTVIDTDKFTISANTGKQFTFPANTRYVKVSYTNGSSAQSSFKLQTLLKRFASKGSSHRLKDALSQEDDGIVTKSLIAGFSSAGGGTLVDVKVNPSGALTVDSTIQAGTNLVGKVVSGYDTSTVYNGTTALTPKFAKIDFSASADIITAVTSKKIRVISMFLVASAECTLKFQSNTTDLQGAMTIKAGAGFVLGKNEVGWFETASGEKLASVVSGTTQISGSLTYIEV